MAPDLFQPDSKFESKCKRFCMNAMRASDLHCVSVLADLSQDGIVQLIEFVLDHQTGTLHIDGKSSVDDVGARQAQVDKA